MTTVVQFDRTHDEEPLWGGMSQAGGKAWALAMDIGDGIDKYRDDPDALAMIHNAAIIEFDRLGVDVHTFMAVSACSEKLKSAIAAARGTVQ